MKTQEMRRLDNDILIDRLEVVLPMYQHVVKHILTQIQGEDRLTLQQLRSLRTIAGSDDGMTTSKLARKLSNASPTVTRIIDGLVERELVERQPDPHDRRRSRLVLATAGGELLDQFERALHAHLTTRFDDLPRERRIVLWDALADLEGILRNPDSRVSSSEGEG